MPEQEAAPWRHGCGPGASWVSRCPLRHTGERNGSGAPTVVGAGGGGWGTRRDSPRWVVGGPEPPHPCGQSGALPRLSPRGWWDVPGATRCRGGEGGPGCGDIPIPVHTGVTRALLQAHTGAKTWWVRWDPCPSTGPPRSRPRSPGLRCQQLPQPRRQGQIIIAAEKLKIAL